MQQYTKYARKQPIEALAFIYKKGMGFDDVPLWMQSRINLGEARFSKSMKLEMRLFLNNRSDGMVDYGHWIVLEEHVRLTTFSPELFDHLYAPVKQNPRGD